MERIGIIAAGACALLAASGNGQTDLRVQRGARPNSDFGTVAALGDVDGDGITDYAIGETGDFWNFSTEPGRVYVYSARNGTLLHELVGDNPGDCFGGAVANAGDVDGDGIDDLIVGAMQWIDWKITGPGYVRIFSGKDFSVIRTINGTQLNAAFGVYVSAAGDVDGDGYADVLVDAQWEQVNGIAYAGSAHLYSGKTGAQLFHWDGNAYFCYAGVGLARLGDLNHDGYDDFLIGSPGENLNGTLGGAARVFSGKDFSVMYEYAGPIQYGDFGLVASGVKDLNGDGVPDFVIGAPAEDSGIELGRVYVYSGADGSLLRLHGGLAAYDAFGSAVECDADLDGDGVPEVVVGAPWATTVDGVLGAIYVFSGATGQELMSEFGKNTGPDPFYGSEFGETLAGLHDLTGDGKDELLVGAIFDQPTPSDTLGAVYLVTLADLAASWKNYGAGWPGTFGVPAFTASAAPEIGTTISLSLENSRGALTTALVFVGFAPASLATSAGGTLLVAPPWIVLPLVLPAAGLDLPIGIPADLTLCGYEIDLQAIEADPGATHALSFTPGLSLVLGGIGT